MCIADVHLGSPESQFRTLIDVIAKADENTYFILLGDILDNAIKDSIGDIYNQDMNPHEAFEQAIGLFEQAKGQILGVIEGNHEARTRKQVGVDILGLLCEERHIPYSNDILVLDIAVGTRAPRDMKRRVQYTLVCGHGYSASRTVGGKITANGRLIDVVVNGDIYLTAHTHQPSILKLARFEADTRNKKIQRRDFYLITVPSWTGYENYAAVKFMHPSAEAFVELELSGLEKHIEVKMR